jgi:thiamine biosynthesis lipoprotein
MGMPVTLKTPDRDIVKLAFGKVFDFFRYVDEQYSPFIDTSDVSKINHQTLVKSDYSPELQEILDYADQTKRETNGYFDVWHDGVFNPSGIVKGWAIQTASKIMSEYTNNFYIEAGGDIQVSGVNDNGQPWRIGVRNPFNRDENIKVVALDNYAIATSGTAIRGQHIYDPVSAKSLTDIISLTVIAPKIIDADRMATAAFAMGRSGIEFIEQLADYEGYMVDANKQAIATTGWKNFEVQS